MNTTSPLFPELQDQNLIFDESGELAFSRIPILQQQKAAMNTNILMPPNQSTYVFESPIAKQNPLTVEDLFRNFSKSIIDTIEDLVRMEKPLAVIFLTESRYMYLGIFIVLFVILLNWILSKE